MLDRRRDADHVDDRVVRADLVEVDAVERDAVDLRLRRPQTLEEGEGALADRSREAALAEQAPDAGEVAAVPGLRGGLAEETLIRGGALRGAVRRTRRRRGSSAVAGWRWGWSCSWWA